ncbi:terminase gpP N-terminus-related DNA-binding protein [Rufibacter quisquiliarum]|uniref:Uncharacterized protein YjcR n=1 Tax=Rufibacter quisquiliarum TaxID=1549639 RepID=A0A839GZ58_9BACT|nr:phage terminase small subunit-related protein [Rufibacter quisquiliarum]MBA9078951.1 uncharacterized protein YjcR [Rufibacter quisquiliarum]
MAKKTAKSENRELAEALYLNTNKTQEEIAARVGVTPKTICAWKEADEWEMKKAIKNSGRQNIIRHFFLEIQQIQQSAQAQDNRMLTDKEVLRIKNLTKSIAELDKKLALDTYVEVFEEFTHWLFNTDSLAAKKMIGHLDQFIDKKLSDLSKS